MAGRYRLIIDQGATLEKRLVYKAGTPKVPVDLTGCTARMQIRATPDATEVLLELTTENGRIALGGTSGEITLLLTPEETAALTWTSGIYDLELVWASGRVKRLLRGGVAVRREVTR